MIMEKKTFTKDEIKNLLTLKNVSEYFEISNMDHNTDIEDLKYRNNTIRRYYNKYLDELDVFKDIDEYCFFVDNYNKLNFILEESTDLLRHFKSIEGKRYVELKLTCEFAARSLKSANKRLIDLQKWMKQYLYAYSVQSVTEHIDKRVSNNKVLYSADLSLFIEFKPFNINGFLRVFKGQSMKIVDFHTYSNYNFRGFIRYKNAVNFANRNYQYILKNN